MHRRDFLKAPAALALTAAPMGAFAQATQFLAVRRQSLGSMTVTALSDGFLPLGHDVLSGIDQTDFDALVTAARLDPTNPVGAVNAYLVEDADRVILIDAGTGAIFGATLGHLLSNLAIAGYEPEAVTHVIATHLHPDHVGGAVTDAGALFPNAELIVPTADHTFFTNPDIRAAAPEEVRGFFDIAVSAVEAYGDRLTLIDGAQSIAPGITAMPLPGHTPGHTGYMLESDGQALLIWGDLVHVPAVQFARPEVTIAFDTDAAQAAATRARLYDQVATDGVMIAGMHMPFPGFGYVDRAGGAYAFVPAPWDYF